MNKHQQIVDDASFLYELFLCVCFLSFCVYVYFFRSVDDWKYSFLFPLQVKKTLRLTYFFSCYYQLMIILYYAVIFPHLYCVVIIYQFYYVFIYTWLLCTFCQFSSRPVLIKSFSHSFYSFCCYYYFLIYSVLK